MRKRSYEEATHIYGRIWTILALLIILSVPVLVTLHFNVTPKWDGLSAALISILILYVPSSLAEVMIYAPMLGSGATYLAFVTGNLVNLKIPCAMNAVEVAKTEFGTKENEIISTLAVATSSIVTLIILAVGVLLIAPLTPALQNPMLQPAFDHVVPALFGALGYKYISKNYKIAIIPLGVMTIVCVLIPSLASQISVLILCGAIISIVGARILYKKGMIK